MWGEDEAEERGGAAAIESRREEASTAAAQVAALLARLPGLRDLRVDLKSFRVPVTLDLRAVDARPTRLALTDVEDPHAGVDSVHLSATTAASLRALALQGGEGYVQYPPGCVRFAGGALTALTRLEYGRTESGGRQGEALDMAPWGAAAAEHGLPALRVLAAYSLYGFTVDGRSHLGLPAGRTGPAGPDWVAGVVAALPRLERLVLGRGPPRRKYGRPDEIMGRTAPLFACDMEYGCGRRACGDCKEVATAAWHRPRREAAECAWAAAVRELVVRALPAADGGRAPPGRRHW